MRNAKHDLRICDAVTPGPWQGLRAAYADCLLVKTPDNEYLISEEDQAFISRAKAKKNTGKE